MASTKKNFAYNLALTVSGYIFPLLTYPYVTRVLGVDNIGKCSFIDSIIQYFVLFSALGVGSYGVREIARYKNDRNKRDEIFTNLFLFQFVTTVIALIVLCICTFTVPAFASYKDFLGVGALQLILNLFLTNWFFQGISDFKFITIRTLLVKVVYVILVFLLVREREDVLLYYFLTCLTIGLNALINWNYGRKFRTLDIRLFHISQHIIPIAVFGLYLILTSAYTTFNTTFLGFWFGDKEVGFFSTACKLYLIIMSIFSAFTGVMVPRVSQLLADGDKGKVQSIATDTTSLIFLFGVPVIVFCEFNAPEIIYLIAGAGYEGAILPFRIVICLLLIIGMEQVFIQQFLMASRSNKAVFAVSVSGASIGIILNLLITPYMASVGSAVCWGISELVVLCVGINLVRKILDIRIDVKIVVRYVLYSSVYILPLLLLRYTSMGSWLFFVLSSFIVLLIFYVISIKVEKNKYLMELVDIIKSHAKHE